MNYESAATGIRGKGVTKSEAVRGGAEPKRKIGFSSTSRGQRDGSSTSDEGKVRRRSQSPRRIRREANGMIYVSNNSLKR